MAGVSGGRVRRIPLAGPLDLRRTLAPLCAGPRDPTFRVAPREALRATRTPDGPATLHLRLEGATLCAEAFGPGAERALDGAADLAGLRDADADAAPESLVPGAPARVWRLGRLARGTRLARSHAVVEGLVPVVLAQKVSGREAERAFRNLVRAFSEPAPGPFSGGEGLWLPLSPAALRALPPAALAPLGVLARQGATLRRVGERARRLEEADAMAHDAAEARLCAIPGIGVWSARQMLLRGMGAADAVPLGDWNLPSAVAFTLSGGREPRADDARMLAWLEPCRGQRGRVLRWIHVAGRYAPRRAPRAPLRPLPSA